MWPVPAGYEEFIGGWLKAIRNGGGVFTRLHLPPPPPPLSFPTLATQARKDLENKIYVKKSNERRAYMPEVIVQYMIGSWSCLCSTRRPSYFFFTNYLQNIQRYNYFLKPIFLTAAKLAQSVERCTAGRASLAVFIPRDWPIIRVLIKVEAIENC